MIVRIANPGNRHHGYYGIVYKDSEHYERHMILFLLDNENNQCITTGWATPAEMEVIPDEEERDAFGWPPALCDSKIHTAASDLAMLVRDGRKYRKIKELLKDEK